MALSKYELMIISKYFNDIEDYINLEKTCKTYLDITELFKFNPIDLPFKNQDEMNLAMKLFKNIRIIHYYKFINEFPHFLNPFIIHFNVNYFPELDNIVEKFKNKCKFDKCTLKEYNPNYFINNLGKDIITDIDTDTGFNICKYTNIINIDLSKYTKLKYIHAKSFMFKDLIGIKLPNSIIEIDKRAFFGNDFEEIDLSNCTNLTKLSCSCFENCRSLKDIKLPSSLIEIDEECFKECNLNKIDLSNCINLTKIGKDCFGYNIINEIKLPTSLTKLDNIIDMYNNNEFTIPDSIMELSPYCFDNATFTKIIFNSNIKIIPHACCFGSEIEQIDLSKCVKLKEIDDLTFGKCWHLKEIDLSNCINLTRLGKDVFYNGLTNIILPTSLIEIDEGCFNYCEDLNEIDLSKCVNLTKIANNAFYKNTIVKLK